VLNSEVLQHRPPDMFCTAAYMRAVPAPGGGLDITVALGGHPPGTIVRAAGGLEQAGEPGTLLGVRAEVTLTDAPHRLGAGDTLVLVTDGVIERRGPDGMFGEAGLARFLGEVAPGTTAERVALDLEQALVEHGPDPPEDDVAIVVVRPQ
jgi:serine phosphatase RsbU (regulator of sigma subunit)